VEGGNTMIKVAFNSIVEVEVTNKSLVVLAYCRAERAQLDITCRNALFLSYVATVREKFWIGFYCGWCSTHTPLHDSSSCTPLLLRRLPSIASNNVDPILCARRGGTALPI